MESRKVSIIIPIYKAEKYLPECIASVLNQTYKNLQIILVDDGSPDRCGDICDKYAELDGRIVVIHQENSGPSAARNCGIQQVTGEYIFFVDADDKLYPTSIQKMVACAEESNAELILGGYLDRSIYGDVEIFEFASQINTKKDLTLAVVGGTGGVLWAKLFRTDIILDRGLLLNEQVHFSEDMLFVLEYIKYIHNWGSIPCTIYEYNRLNELSITTRKDQSLCDSYAFFALALKSELTQLKIEQKTVERIVNEKVIRFVDTILKNAQDPKSAFKIIRRNDTLFSVIQSQCIPLPKAIQLAQKGKWFSLDMRNRRDAFVRGISIIWHWMVKRKNELLCRCLSGKQSGR